MINVQFIPYLSLTIIDIKLAIEENDRLTMFTFCFSGVCYSIIFCLLVIVSFRVAFVDSHDYDPTHPKPKSMMVCGFIISFCVLTRVVYDIASAVVGKSVISCLDTSENPTTSTEIGNGNCIAGMDDELTQSIGEIICMTVWEIIPLICLIVCFWKIPKKQDYMPFDQWFKLSERESLNYEYDELVSN